MDLKTELQALISDVELKSGDGTVQLFLRCAHLVTALTQDAIEVPADVFADLNAEQRQIVLMGFAMFRLQMLGAEK